LDFLGSQKFVKNFYELANGNMPQKNSHRTKNARNKSSHDTSINLPFSSLPNFKRTCHQSMYTEHLQKTSHLHVKLTTGEIVPQMIISTIGGSRLIQKKVFKNTKTLKNKGQKIFPPRLFLNQNIF
jgi:hypothetical protein